MAETAPPLIMKKSTGGTVEPMLAYEETAEGKLALGVFIQDQTTPALFVKANKVTNTTTLSAPASLGDFDIDVTSAVGIVVGNYLGLFNVTSNRFYVGTVLAINTNTLTLDTPLDSAFDVGDVVGTGITNMAVDGTPASPQVFSVRGADPGIAVTVDVTRIIITCTTTGLVDLTKFGDIVGGLDSGIVMRRVDGATFNILNWKTNFELAGSMYDWVAFEKANPAQGVDGFVSRLTFAGQSKVGVALRLAPGENIEFLVQDPVLTDGGITKLEIMLEGHVVQ